MILMSFEKPLVIIKKSEDIKEAVYEVLKRLPLPNLNNKNILIKPNVGREVNPKEALNTNPEVVEAVYDYLSERFKAKFYLGDSPIIGVDTYKAFSKSGYDYLIKNKIKFLNLDEPVPIELICNENFLVKKIRVTGYYNRFDYIISIPVIKMHIHTGASLSFKNLKGLIYKRDKVNLHHFNEPEILKSLNENNKLMKELDIAISDLYNFFKPDLAIIDGSYALEGLGPSSGRAVRLNIIIGSTNFLAADIVALKIVQPDWELDHVPHLQLISKRFFNKKLYSLNDIKTDPENINEFIHKIEPPPTSISIKYPNVELIDVDSCSSCLNTIFIFLKDNKEFIDKYFTKKNPLRIAIGKGIKQSDIYEHTFLIGNCTSNCKDYGIFIKGCTPVQSKILAVIKEYFKINEI